MTIVRPLTLLALTALLPSTASAQVELRVQAEGLAKDAAGLNGEVAVVSNDGTLPLDLGGWRLCDAVWHCYVFPDGTALGPGGDLRVYTGSGRDTLRELYMGFDRPIWDDWADLATLSDDEGEVRARCLWDRGRGIRCR